jgi:hypothetical protein
MALQTSTGLTVMSSKPSRGRTFSEIRTLLGTYAAYGVNSLPMFRDNLSVPTS